MQRPGGRLRLPFSRPSHASAQHPKRTSSPTDVSTAGVRSANLKRGVADLWAGLLALLQLLSCRADCRLCSEGRWEGAAGGCVAPMGERGVRCRSGLACGRGPGVASALTARRVGPAHRWRRSLMPSFCIARSVLCAKHDCPERAKSARWLRSPLRRCGQLLSEAQFRQARVFPRCRHAEAGRGRR